MCGIIGILGWSTPPDPDLTRQMTRALAHRGPDAEGVRCQPHAFGHRRLAVIDLSPGANQPMADATGDCIIVYNGELYNFREIRRTLSSDGVSFRTDSDTEVILEAYRRWDVACLERFNGMFAFGLWDNRRQRLLLARDRAGEKPLYYQALPDGLVFASELNAMRLHPAVSTCLNRRALGQYLAFNYVLAPDSLVEGVSKLEPAHYLLVERGRPLAPVRYWDLAAHFHAKRRFRSHDEAAEALTAAIDRAVALRLVSDVPVGAFLSGGVDSSTVLASICAQRPSAQNRTFSMGFQEDTYDERVWARQAASHLGLAGHLEQIVSPDMAAILPTIVRAGDEPMADTSIIPVYFLSAFARQHVTVCLSGEGADETLGGYETYLADQLRRATQFAPAGVSRLAAATAEALLPVNFGQLGLPYKMRQFLRGHRLPFARAHATWRLIFDEDERRQLVRPEHHAAVLAPDPFDAFTRHDTDVRACHDLDRATYIDIKTWLADDILVKVDRMTMAHGLESRAPFLDHELMEFAAALPPSLKVRRTTKKYLLKRSQRSRLPHAIIDRKKQGFNAPVSHWFAGPLEELGRAATAPAVMGEWLNPAAVERLWTEHSARQRDHGFKLFGLTVLGLWLQQAA
ncbi:MAG: asparagine synthase (glutamine-hydrolyzing) [Acidobacteriota bacterium]